MIYIIYIYYDLYTLLNNLLFALIEKALHEIVYKLI